MVYEISLLSPDRNIEITLDRRENISIAFLNDSYDRYSESVLEAQLTGGLRLMMMERQRAKIERRRQSGLVFASEKESLIDSQWRRYYSEVQKIEVEGLSLDESICVTATAMRNIAVSIADGYLDDVDASEFAASFSSATADAIMDHRDQVRALKLLIFENV